MGTIHLINPMWCRTGGSEWRTYELYRLLNPRAKVKVWSLEDSSPEWKSILPIKRIAPWRLQMPMSGTLVFVGVYFKYGSWVRYARPERTIIVYNTPQNDLFHARSHFLERNGKVPIEIVYASSWMRRDLGLEGTVQISPIDLDRFKSNPAAPGRTRFTVGRLSRDIAIKHHPGDLGFYQRIADQGAAVRVMGGTCLREQGSPASSVTLLPENVEPPEAFLGALDCFFYRTDDAWHEPHGRVVQEAMACGLPVVCSRRGGYAEYIQHRENGFLFDQESEAFDILTELQSNPVLCHRVGSAARRSMEKFHSAEALEDIANYYLNGADKS